MQRIWIKIIYAILQACGLFVASGTAGYVISPKFLQCGTVSIGTIGDDLSGASGPWSFGSAFDRAPAIVLMTANNQWVNAMGSAGSASVFTVLWNKPIASSIISVTVKWLAIDPLYVFKRIGTGGGFRKACKIFPVPVWNAHERGWAA
ncbi:MAG: hypothetical protein LBS91_02920 [Clostridiales Family XIII bacterium]|jgi:hypothetical protein|nr:hypothetical protein [Clostridiales Family XIII bacterium]